MPIMPTSRDRPWTNPLIETVGILEEGCQFRMPGSEATLIPKVTVKLFSRIASNYCHGRSSNTVRCRLCQPIVDLVHRRFLARCEKIAAFSASRSDDQVFNPLITEPRQVIREVWALSEQDIVETAAQVCLDQKALYLEMRSQRDASCAHPTGPLPSGKMSRSGGATA